MLKRLRLLTAVILLAVLWTGCNSSVQRKNTNDSSPPNSVLEINDSDWELKLVHRFKIGEKRWRVRCNSDNLCWAWTQHSIMISESPSSWRDFYSLPSDRISKTRIDSVFIQTPSIAWTVQNSELYKTQDGARSWDRVVISNIEGTESSVQDIFFNKDHGQAVGGRFQPLAKNDPLINTELREGHIRTAFILETEDGVSWKYLQIPRLIGALTELDYWDKTLGVASSRNNLLVTTDQGKTWTDMSKYFPTVESERGSFASGFFKDSDMGWLLFVGFDFETYFTDNMGKTWSKAVWKLDSHINDTSSFPPPPRFAFVDAARGLFVYGNSMGGELFKTSDGGKTWAQIKSPDETFSDVVFNKGGAGFIVSDRGIYRVDPKQ